MNHLSDVPFGSQVTLKSMGILHRTILRRPCESSVLIDPPLLLSNFGGSSKGGGDRGTVWTEKTLESGRIR